MLDIEEKTRTEEFRKVRPGLTHVMRLLLVNLKIASVNSHAKKIGTTGKAFMLEKNGFFSEKSI